MNNIGETSFILETWRELEIELETNGIIFNDNGVVNTVILALAKCYREGEEQGFAKGKLFAFDITENFIKQQ